MAPRAKAKSSNAKAKAKAAPKQEDQLALQDAAERKRKEQSNMITQLNKRAKETALGDPDKAQEIANAKEFLNTYNSLGRFSEEKTKLLAIWQGNKKLSNWQNMYSESRAVSNSSSTDGAQGFGTK